MSHTYEFFTRFARILNSGQARSVVLSGNIYDLFWDGESYVPLIPFVCKKAKAGGVIQLVYELNGPIRMSQEDHRELADAWVRWKTGVDADTLAIREMSRKESQSEQLRAEFNQYVRDATGNSTQALEFLRQLTICSRSVLRANLLIIIEAADMLLPAGNGDIAALNDRQMRRISIVQDWFGDPAFVGGGDSVCLVAESRSLIHPRLAKLPQVLSVDVPSPTTTDRKHYIDNFIETSDHKPELWATSQELAEFCAGLSNHAIRQLLAGSAYAGEPLTPNQVVGKVEEFIQGQLGEDVVEFKKPEHRLEHVVGFSQLKEFLRRELIPRFKAKGEQALPGAAVAGPIGGGKTFIFEAVAAEVDVPVLVLKSIRSQWFGQTDVIFERLRRVLEALEKVVIFVDEADTQFGRVDSTAHDTERRLTGKIQAMMSDPRLRGRVIWLLMTARIHLLSPDIRRPGRVGDLIIPVLDPRGDDRRDFIKWVLKATQLSDEDRKVLTEQLDDIVLAHDYSAAAYAALRSQIKAQQPTDHDAVLNIVSDIIPPAIGLTRRYQTLQALVNCTRRSLLPDSDSTNATRDDWEKELRELERQEVL
ncbi:MAG: AAA family ATPase [Planctomycetaceae bacterium]|nr:AAA family ATPase [Planctomycetales bacterium]MCB9873043.1 AAA family ATPase [Planctomycetaceae bacterium]MCB9937036.1 AAA family ATPase [Planctomycetaceae bacterium]HRX81596.1 ATP-binding protein [Pirellulaceae bacterium]